MNFFLRGCFLSILILFWGHNISQNGIVGSGFTSGWGSAGNNANNYEDFSASAGNSYIFTDNPNGTGNQYFRLGVNWSGTYKQLTINPGSDDLISANTEYQLNTNNTSSGAMYINVSDAAHNYIFKTNDAGTNPTGKFIFFKVEGDVRTISSVSEPSDLRPFNTAQTITVTLSGALNTGQGVYIRYSNDNWTSSSIVEMSQSSGSTYTGDIPNSAPILIVDCIVLFNTLL